MYCINCGVKLADTEKQCPLCATPVFHPDLQRAEGEKLYPSTREPIPPVSYRGLQIVVTTVFLLPMLISLLCDLHLNSRMVWSGYVIGGLALTYVCAVLPVWFRRPNPVIFVPIGFAGAALYLLYISLATGGGWFLTFAFPVTGVVGLVVTAVVTLFRYIRRGRLYIMGGAAVTLGLFMPLMGFLLNVTFFEPGFALWSLYPLIALVLPGLMLIFLAIFPPARDSMERKFFL